MADIIMPKMGDAMEEGKIVQWLKKVGDDVKAGEAIAEIETDKSNVEIEAEAGGTLQSIAVQAGEIAPVGATIAVVGSGAAAVVAPAAVTPAPRAEAPKVEPESAPVAPVAPAEPAPKSGSNGTGPAAPTPAPVPVATPAAAPVASGPLTVSRPEGFKPYDSFVGSLPEGLGGSASTIGEPIVVSGGASGSERVRATPLARAMAQSHNLDLAALRGTGPDGGIVKADVESAIAGGGATVAAPVSATTPAAPAPTPTPAAQVADGDEVQEYNAMRRTIAKRLSESKSTIPHFYVTAEIDVEALFVLREQVNAGGAEGTAKVSLNDFLVKAVAVALAENPVINSSFLDNKRILRKAINIGIAVSIDDGLIVPVVKDCESKSLRAISKETRPLIEKAREGKLKPDQYTGGTFTISNLGQYDVENFAAIINPGEGAILAVSSIRLVAAVVDGQVVPRKRMNVTLCADHRVMDGVAGAMFLQSLKRAIENPLQILA